ncbi:transporter substrate-binding domain-containing protein [Desulfobotulus sp. H1]|uniref:Transporter substrate-binding domain-containing protein n=1 Tax=Desulfobotulus pelophilus TaxID=2823377 RepID=A0ABT3N6H8_9BACT|nr:transporter substrate-binding domain-containing protein [Desulfobotulus pelophilus]MCW7753063.1 transporter substrate-binding domain-containing protein [Desulfobotulus pelophilus]
MEVFSTQSWDESLVLSKKGKCILLPFLNRTPERDVWLNFTRPYFIDSHVFVTRVDHDYIANVAGLRNKIMVLPLGTSVEERVRMDYPNLDLVIVPDEVTVFRMVEDGRADMTLRSLTMAAHTIRKEGRFNLKIAGGIPAYANELRAGVHRDYPELRDRLDAAIATLIPEEIQDAVNRHVPIRVGYRMGHGLFFQVAGTLLLLLMAAGLWTVQLRLFNRKLAGLAEKARRAEQHLRQLIDLMPGYVFVRDQQGRFVITNRALADLLGCLPDRVAGKTDLDYGRIRIMYSCIWQRITW